MGPALLIAAALLATTAALAAAMGRTESTLLFRLAVTATWGAVLAIVIALIRVDTSLEIVALHTRPGLNAARRVMGLWGGSAGSLLFFAAVLGVVLAAIRPEPRLARVAAPAVTATLLWASVVVASPFERLDVPVIAGSGLSPILEHWAMLIHPPLLYTGLALCLLPGLLGADPRANVVSRAAVAVLTAALALGGRWAYTEIGWGGWWAWDPVENAALIPWFLLIVHLHVPPAHSLHRWAGLLLWPAVFAGSAMTRTSLRTSVHAFANADDIGWFLWPLTAAVSVGALVVGFRTPRRGSTSSVRMLPVGLAFFAALVVALGTYRPFLPGEATDGTFFARYLWPVAIVAIIGLGLAPAARVARRIGWRGIGAAVALGAVVGAVVAIALGATIWWQVVHAAALGATIPALRHASSRRQLVAHLGLWMVLLGALGGTASTQRTFALDAGEWDDVQTRRIENLDLQVSGENPTVIEATVLLNGSTELVPSLAVYPDRALRLPEVATRNGVFEDVQVVLRSADDDDSIVITVNVEPLASWVWLGSLAVTVSMLLPAEIRTRRSARAVPSAAH